MIKRELKYNLKSFIIWAVILISMYLIVLLIYPTVIGGANAESLEEMMKAFSPEVLAAFNMDLSGIETAYGWIKTEGFVFILLLVGAYAAILGSNILLKEESDKTIEYLNSLPISRKRILLSKFFVGLFYITLLVISIGIFNYVGLSVNEIVPKKEYLLLSITPIFSSYVIYTLCIFISTFFHKTKQIFGVSLGIVFISYILNVLSELDSSVKKLRYLSAYTLSDVRNVLSNIEIRPIMIIITFSLTLILLIASLIRFEKKDLLD